MRRPGRKTKKRSEIWADKKKKLGVAERALSKGQEQENQIKRMEELIPLLDEAYKDYGRGKTSVEPKPLRRELENSMREYQKGIIVRAVHKFKFQNVQSKYALYRPKWDAIIREVRKRNADTSTASFSDLEKETIEKLLDEI